MQLPVTLNNNILRQKLNISKYKDNKNQNKAHAIEMREHQTWNSISSIYFLKLHKQPHITIIYL